MHRISRNKEFVNSSWYGDTILTCAVELTKLFGEPGLGDLDKTKYEWNLILDDEIPFDIYDWKEDDLSEDVYTYYHIGARNETESSIVKNILKNMIKKWKIH